MDLDKMGKKPDWRELSRKLEERITFDNLILKLFKGRLRNEGSCYMKWGQESLTTSL